jgi:hypothetical protein
MSVPTIEGERLTIADYVSGKSFSVAIESEKALEEG